MDGFPELDGPSVFLASPGDVAYLRETVANELELLKQQVADDQGFELYACEIDKAMDGFDDYRPAQQQIPRPDDPHCRAVICLLGEKIGTPLKENFPLHPLDGLKVCDDSLEYRLVHPWKPGAADTGGFALTGTTFEFLTALAANEQRQANPGASLPPIKIFLRVVGDESILDPNLSPGQANWGMRKLRNLGKDRYANDDDKYAVWFAEARDQLKQLNNFVRFIQNQNYIQVQFVSGADELRQMLRGFLVRELGLRVDPGDHDPFKGLNVYDVEDNDVFFGREAERKEAIESFFALWKDQEKPSAFAIIGGSGVGKSSFLRAGVMAPLRRERVRGRFLDCMLRPGDLLSDEALAHTPASSDHTTVALRRLFLMGLERIACEQQADNDLSVRLEEVGADFDTIPSEQRPKFSVRQLSKALDKFDRGANLLFGFDQFEELIDQRGDDNAAPFWQPVAEFLAEAVRCGRLGLLYTLQANRVDLVMKDPVFGPLLANGEEQWLVFPAQSLGEIIRRPFNFTPSIEISPELVNELRRVINDFKNNEASGAVQGSLLPLVSLTLRRIYEKRALPLSDELFAKRRAKDAESTDDLNTGFTSAANDTDHGSDATELAPIVTLTPENCAGYLKVEDAIAELANEAMEDAKAAAGPDWSEAIVGDLLRRLVELHGERYSLPYAVMPSAPSARKLAEALRERRLLLQEPDGHIRLVHEAVLSHWQSALDWRDNEHDLLNDAMVLEGIARAWDTGQRTRQYLQECGRIDVDRAARILAMWYDLLADPAVLAHNHSKSLVRDFSLELLFTHPSPARIVNSPRQPTHMVIAASYGRADMVRRYIELVPDSVHQPRADNRTPIFWSCFLGDEAILEMFLEQGANVEQCDEFGWRPIHLAAASGHVNCLQRLVESGATLQSPGTPGETKPLHLAARNGHSAMIRYLIGTCAMAPAVTDNRKWTPLHTAASFGQTASICALCEYDVDLEAALAYGWTALHLAAKEGHVSAVNALIQVGASVNAVLVNEWTTLHVAAKEGQVGVARALIAGGADAAAKGVNDWSSEKQVREKINKRDPSKRGSHNENFDWQPLHVAADTNHPDMVVVLTGGGAHPDAKTASGETALHLAARKGYRKLIEPLKAAGADLQYRNANRHTPLQVALDNNQYDFAAALVRNGVDVDVPRTDKEFNSADTWTALQSAAHEGQTERAVFLLGLGANPNAADTARRTPLHLAAAKGHSDIIERLLEHGVRGEAIAGDGTTALHLACLAGHRDIVERLVRHGVAVDQAAANAVTPLHLAAASGNVDVVELLLQWQHKVDCNDRDGWTPLHVAAQQGWHQIVYTLLAAQANPNTLALRPAMSPLQVAAEVGHDEVVSALLAKGADSAQASDTHGPAIALALRYGHFDVALRLVAHGNSLDQIDPVSGYSLAGLFRQALKSRLQQDGTLTDVEARLRAAFKEIGVDVEIPVFPDTAHPATKVAEKAEPADVQLGNVSNYPWSLVPQEVVKLLVDRLNPIDGKYRVNPESTTFARCTLPWYPGFHLYRLTDVTLARPKLSIYYLQSPEGHLFRLNGTSPPIHEVNKKLPIVLNKHTILDYLRFFCFFVRGDEGPFYIVDSVNDPLLPDDPVVQKVLANTIRPATFAGCDQQGRYRCNAIIFYSNALFVAHFAIQPSGMLDMLSDEPIAGDLPAKLDVPIA
jgi:ankyrin repeat protein